MGRKDFIDSMGIPKDSLNSSHYDIKYHAVEKKVRGITTFSPRTIDIHRLIEDEDPNKNKHELFKPRIKVKKESFNNKDQHYFVLED